MITLAKDKSNVERDVEVEVDITQRKMIGKSLGEKIFDVVNYTLITFICLICLYPMLYVLFASLSNGNKLYTHVGPIWAPLQPMTLEGYQHVLSNPDILTGYYNTLIYVVAGTLFSMLLTVLGAYVLSRTDYTMQSMGIEDAIAITQEAVDQFNAKSIPTAWISK